MAMTQETSDLPSWLRASGVAHASHLVAVTDRQEQGRGCIKEESGAVGEGLLLGGPWGSKVRWISLLEPYDQKDDRKGSFQAYKHKVKFIS